METTKDIAWEVASTLRGSVNERGYSFIAVMAICHAKRAALAHFSSDIAYNENIVMNLIEAVSANDDEGCISHFVAEVLTSGRYLAEADEAVRRVYGILPDDPDELADIILDIELEEDLASQFMRFEGITPRSVTELAVRALNIVEGNCVADFGTGTGSFLVRASRESDFCGNCEDARRSHWP